MFNSNRSCNSFKAKKPCNSNGLTIRINCIWCIGSLSNLFIAGTIIVTTYKIIWTTIFPIGATEPKSTYRKVNTWLKCVVLVIIFAFVFRYYCLDDYVAREILGKKLSSRYRKDLDEVAERTGSRLKSCR